MSEEKTEAKVYQLTLTESEARSLCFAWGIACAILLRTKDLFLFASNNFVEDSNREKEIQDKGGPEAGVESLSEKLGPIAGEVIHPVSK
jgi:hypothetical protein